MKGSVAQQVASHVAKRPARSFIEVSSVEGSRSAVESAFSRLAALGEITRVRKGMYWKGVKTPFGMSPPRVEDAAIAIGGPGSGPAGIAAAHWLGLTSQVPSTYLTAVPKQAPNAWEGVRFTQRPFERRMRGLSPSEVAVIEVLRSGPGVVETRWERLAEVIAEQASNGEVRPTVLDAQISEERDRKARSRWSELCHSNPELLAAA